MYAIRSYYVIRWMSLFNAAFAVDFVLGAALGAGTSFREAVEYSAAGDRIVFDAGLTGTVS